MVVIVLVPISVLYFNHISSVQFKMVSMRSEKPITMHSTLSLRSLSNVAFETVPVFVWLTVSLSCSVKEDYLGLSLSTPLSSR